MSLWIDKKYLKLVSPRLRNVKWKDDKLLNHSCPYCGDSSKNELKARGYHFVHKDTYVYKCHNCGHSTNVGIFLKDQDDMLYKQWVMEKFGKKKDTRPVAQQNFTFEPPKFKSNPLAKYPKAEDSQLCVDYLTRRQIPKKWWKDFYFVEKSQSLSSINYKYNKRVLGNDPRLVLPFYDRQKNLIGLTGRALNDSQLRYLTLRFDEEKPLIFNLDKVDFNQPLYVVEGPIDSLFLPNCIAVGGSDFSKVTNEISKSNSTLIFDNEPRNKEIIKKMRSMGDQGYKVCVWPETIKEKDINDMVLNQIPNIIDVINNNTLQGLSLNLAINNWSKV